MLPILKNLPPGTSATGHMLAFTPKPYRLVTEQRAEGEDKFVVGDFGRTATRYLVKLELRGLTGVVASVIGKDPPDLRYWITTGPAPWVREARGTDVPEGPELARRVSDTALARGVDLVLPRVRVVANTASG